MYFRKKILSEEHFDVPEDCCCSVKNHVRLFAMPVVFKNTGVGCHFLLQGIFPTHGSNPWSPALEADSLPTELPGKLWPRTSPTLTLVNILVFILGKTWRLGKLANPLLPLTFPAVGMCNLSSHRAGRQSDSGKESIPDQGGLTLWTLTHVGSGGLCT